MLRRAAFTGAVVALGLVVPATALAGTHQPVVVTGNNDGVVQTTVTDPGAQGRATSGATSVAYRDACVWVQVGDFQRVPLPSSHPGTWWRQYCNGYSTLPVFVPASASAPQRLQTPATLAVEAESRLPLPAPEAAHNPSGDALVNLPTWWWVEKSQWHSLTQRTAAGPVWAEVTARPVRSVWDAGDGSPALWCDGGGTPYDTKRPAESQSTECSHTYSRSSAGQPETGPDPNDRFFTVTVTVYWQVSWVGAGGTGGALPVMSRTSTFPLRVVERQTVVTGGSG